MFYAAHVAFWAAGTQPSRTVIKSHSGLISLFGQHVVKAGLIDAEHGRAIGQTHKTRLLTDYTDEPPTDENAREALDPAEAFVAVVREKFLREPG